MPRPLADSYWTTVGIVIGVLSPYIVLTTATFLLEKQLGADLRATPTELQVASGLSNAAYAFGALVGGDIAQRFPQRPLFFLCSLPLFAGFLIAATAGGYVQFASGHVLQGLATGLLLVVAVPPLVQRFPTARMPTTTAMINIGFFGAVCAGPVLGGYVAELHAWRWFVGGLGGVVLAATLLATLTLPDREPPNPELRFDATAVVLGLTATVLSFLAVSRLRSISFGSPFFVALLTVGVVALVALLVFEYHRDDQALSPVKPLSSTIPSVGTLAATLGGGAFVTLVELTELYLQKVGNHPPLRVGIDFLPQIAGVLIAAAALGALVRTRFLPHLTLAGMVALIAAAGVLTAFGAGTSRATVLLVTGLLGVGAGAAVSPGLWLAGMSLPVQLVGRTFALVELVRSLGDFVLAPVISKLATVYGKPSVLHGLHVAIWTTLIVTAAGTGVGLLLWWLGAAGAPEPDLEAWQEDGDTAFHSPRQLARFRGEPEPAQ